ncbi:hypothetical protein TON_1101 [Thermococcus onnurineus NA1]|uniref:Uncharacterized protein n=1 Tax=Thermococcus onnurineus (strain NA1) TaxID=523850 RepID=B6YWX6_THEON|nr:MULTISPECIES: hypothetical protein [Thermococcus]ACJ16589.1 hypothetical protein TON_1101 [Thermococcus onnurineus NA1]NJD99745.1 hypothetical protein [Thermococcus sp. LS1]NJE41671.1 hypothetical protein [Thermococcus sp. GR6]NJE47434.1 hypothetical protein [Thermococcus sp. GR7]NJE79269.1 hypothetical protein [Thermococcus sp. GR4]
MDAKEIVKILDEKGEVSLETWKAVSVKKNKDGTVDILYKNLHVGTDDDPVFLWIYANIVEEDWEVRVLERITFKREDLAWILRYVAKKKGEGL